MWSGFSTKGGDSRYEAFDHVVKCDIQVCVNQLLAVSLREMLPSSSGWKFANSDQIILSKEDLNRRLSIGVGILIDFNRHLDLDGMAFNLCVCQIVPGGILYVLAITSYSY